MNWRLFPEEPRQALRLKRYFMAAFSYFLWLGLSYYCYRLGLVDASGTTFLWCVILIALCNVVFFLLLRSGFNLYWPDPSLTLPQMIVATFWVMLLVALAPAIRGTLLLLYVVVFLFGIFRLNRRQYLGLTALVLAGYGLVVLYDIYNPSAQLPLSLEFLNYSVLAVTLVWLAFFGSYVGRMRETLRERNTELAAALEKNRLLAVRDDLTGAYNRRYMLAQLQEEQLRAHRTGRGFCVCLLDLDRFKEINDRHGHLVGDEILKRFAQCVTAETRMLDRVGRDGMDGSENFGRYGGEEFLLVMPETGLEGARIGADRLRRKVADTAFATEVGTLRLTVSIGIAEYRPDEGIRETLRRADRALYSAKEAGRDRVMTDIP